MGKFLKLFFIAFLIAVTFTGAVKAADDIKLCEQGVRYCAEFERKDDKKYSACMKRACSAYYPEAEREKNGDKYFFKLDNFSVETERVTEGNLKTCEYGIRKCDELSYSSTYYWRCMKNECRTRSIDYSPNCDLGVTYCKDALTEFRSCVNTSCNHKPGVFDECTESKKVCTNSLRNYYHCVYRICLGPVDQYVYFADVKKYAIVEDRFGIKRRIEVQRHDVKQEGVPPEEQQAPPGVDPEEWIRDIPLERRISRNPSETMRCVFPMANIECQTSDVASCFCSDGSKPISIYDWPNYFDSPEEIKFFADKNAIFEELLQNEFKKRGYYDELDKKYGVVRTDSPPVPR